MILDKITAPNSIQEIPDKELEVLADEIREFMIDRISKNGGHLGSNLGAVELTIALHRCLHFPEDKLIWDVGHQSYTHKILTGRKDQFSTLRQQDGLSGFPKRTESECDAFDTGHSSTSISAAVGYARARDLLNQKYNIVAVIGDGALTGGMAYEAMNNAAELKSNLIIVLNDNNMSITNNVGGMSKYLSRVRTAEVYTGMKMEVANTLKKIPGIGDNIIDTVRRTKSGIKQLIIPGMLFENMGLTYLGPINGHNILQMTRTFQEAKRVEGPVVVHVVTEKGKGYGHAERHPARFHGTGPFDVETGLPKKKSKPTWTDIFSTVMFKLGAKEERLAAITAAMIPGTGLKRFQNKYPERCFDVGIAEEHAVTFAAALSLGGMIPVFAVYSSFLQRAFDQVLHDVCMQNLHVIFAIDRAGLVGADGETHQGCYDLSYLSVMPNMTVMAPKNLWELSDMMKFAVRYDGPIAVRYPRGEAYQGLKEFREEVQYGKAEVIERGKDLAVLFIGNMADTAVQVTEKLKEKGYCPTLVNLRFAKPLDEGLIRELTKDHKWFITLEENTIRGGVGEQILTLVSTQRTDAQVLVKALPDRFITQGKVEDLFVETGLDVDSVLKDISNLIGE